MRGRTIRSWPRGPRRYETDVKNIRVRSQGIAIVSLLGQRYRLPKSDDRVDTESGFLAGSKLAPRLGTLRLLAEGLAATGFAAAAGSSAVMARR